MDEPFWDQPAEVERLTDALQTIHAVCVDTMKAGGSFANLLAIESIARHALAGVALKGETDE